MSFLHVLEVRVVGRNVLWLRFSDGAQGAVDLTDVLAGEVLGAVADPTVFDAVALDDDGYTVCWPNGADLAPEFLRERIVTTSHGRVAERPAS